MEKPRRVIAQIIVVSACLAGCVGALPPNERPPNERPMYGNVPKNDAMQKADREFIDNILALGLSRQEGSRHAAMRGRQFFDKRDYATAMKRFNQAWLLDPENADSYYGFALVTAERKGSPAEVEKYFLMALEKPSVSVQAHVDYGRFLWTQARYDESLERLNRALEIEPKAYLARAHIAFVYYKKHEFDRACHWAKQAEEHREELERGFLRTVCRLKDEMALLEDMPSPQEQPARSAAGTLPTTRKAGETFKDCAGCPEMVMIPAGTFAMGSPPNEADREGFEGPQHRVVIPAPLAVGKFEVTRGEFAAFVKDSGYSVVPGCRRWNGKAYETDPERGWRNPGFPQSDRDPVSCVTQDDAKAYAAWLSNKTGKGYRLLSEAEWEYAARAGTVTAWSCGASGNCLGAVAWYIPNSGRMPQQVGGKAANGFGLHDLHGNIHELVEDCWHDNYIGAPADGSAWGAMEQNCSNIVVRGGWSGSNSMNLRSAKRFKVGASFRYNYLGFRVARTLYTKSQ